MKRLEALQDVSSPLGYLCINLARKALKKPFKRFLDGLVTIVKGRW